jgi:hypothetical protein
VLPRVQRPTLIPLVALRQLFLRGDVEIARCDGELLHVGLGVHILNTLVDVVDRAGVLLVLRLRQVLELAEPVLLVDHRVADELLGLSRGP